MSDVKPENNKKPSEMSDLQAKLDAANAIIQQRDQELLDAKTALEAKQDSGVNRKVRVASDVVFGDGYEFEVGLVKQHPQLLSKKVRCCDESEAVRWFILTNAHPDKPGVQIDPCAFPVYAKCVDPRREERIKQDKLIGNLRSKAERSQILSEVEQSLLDAADEKVFSQ